MVINSNSWQKYFVLNWLLVPLVRIFLEFYLISLVLWLGNRGLIYRSGCLLNLFSPVTETPAQNWWEALLFRKYPWLSQEIQ